MTEQAASVGRSGSASLQQPDYWWYRARSELLETALTGYLGVPRRTLDVGSADGPSVAWMRRGQRHTTLDINPEGLVAGEGVCGSTTALPFADEVFDVVSAFDVVEHCADEGAAVHELARVLSPGGRLLLSVPAYQWAWSDHDVRAGHHRRYTRPRLVHVVESSGLRVERASYAFCAVFPMFVAERAVRRLRSRRRREESRGQRLTPVSPAMDAVLIRLCRVDRALLRHGNLPFGSSVLLAATKPGSGG